MCVHTYLHLDPFFFSFFFFFPLYIPCTSFLSPFYFSQAPDGFDIVVQINTMDFFEASEVLSIYNVQADGSETPIASFTNHTHYSQYYRLKGPQARVHFQSELEAREAPDGQTHLFYVYVFFVRRPLPPVTFTNNPVATPNGLPGTAISTQGNSLASLFHSLLIQVYFNVRKDFENCSMPLQIGLLLYLLNPLPLHYIVLNAYI
jgi:hypothetical protein